MTKNLLFLIGSFLACGLSAQKIEPRKPQKEVISEASKKAGVFIDVNAASYPDQLIRRYSL